MRGISARSASRTIDWWPWRHTRNVRAFAAAAGNEHVATSAAATLTRITERGTTAIPAPAATHATIAWYEPNSSTRSGTTFASPNQLSRRRR